MPKKIKEIEIKYYLDKEGKDHLLERLKKYKAEFKGHRIEIDVYYSRPDVDFMKTRECLRLRKRGELSEITYKPPTTKRMETEKKFWKKEVNLRFRNQTDEARELFKDLGMVELVEVKKERDIYKIYDVIISIDYIEKLGWFVELEVQTDDEAYAFQTLESYAVKLCLEEDNIATEPYRDLVMKQKSNKDKEKREKQRG